MPDSFMCFVTNPGLSDHNIVGSISDSFSISCSTNEMSVEDKLGQKILVFDPSKVPYNTASSGSRLENDNKRMISMRLSESDVNEKTLDKCNEDDLNIDLVTLPKKQSDHRSVACYNSRISGEHKVLSWRYKRGRNKRNRDLLAFSSNQTPSRRHHIRRWLNEKTEEVKENRSLPQASRAAAHIEVTQPIDTNKNNREALDKDFPKSERKNATYLESIEYRNNKRNDKQCFERSQSIINSQNNGELNTMPGAMKNTKKHVNKNYSDDDDDDDSQVITYPRRLSPNCITSIKHHPQTAYNSDRLSDSPLVGGLKKDFLPINVKSELSLQSHLVSSDKSDKSDDNFDIQRSRTRHIDETYDPLVSMDEGSKFVLFSSAESALDNSTEDSIREGDASVSLLDTVCSDDDSKETVWNQVASYRRHRLLLQMESLTPRSFLLANLTSDW